MYLPTEICKLPYFQISAIRVWYLIVFVWYYSLAVKTKPLDIVYNAGLIKRITEFFEITKSEHRVQMELAGMQTALKQGKSLNGLEFKYFIVVFLCCY